jgi:hypothetical protein
MEARICDVCKRVIAEHVCKFCGKDCCVKCKRILMFNLSRIPNTNEYYTSNSLRHEASTFKMYKFSSCEDCFKLIPFRSKDMLNEEVPSHMLDELMKRMMAEKIKSSGGITSFGEEEK